MRVVAAFASNTLFNFVTGLLLAKFLGPEDYGLFALAVAAAVLLQTIAFDWARLAAARFYSQRIREEEPQLRATLDASLAALVLGLVAITAALLLSGLSPTVSPELAALAVGVAVANGVFDYGTALVRARFRDDLYLILVTAKNVLSLALTVGGAYWFGSARVALLGVVLSMAGSLLGVGRNLVDRRPRAGLVQPRLAMSLFRYGLPITLANLFYQTIPLVDRIVIARTFGLAESGQFSFAYDIGVRIIAAVGSMLDVLLFQIAVRADEMHGTDEGRRQIGRNIGLVIAVLAPACAGLWLVLPSFEALVVPAEFRGAFARTLSLLLPGLFCYGLIFFGLNPLFQINKTTIPLVAVAIGASLVNLLAIAALPQGASSFAAAQALALLFGAVALVVWARVLRPFWPPWRDLVGAAIGTAAVAAVAALLTEIAKPGLMLLTLQVGAGAAVYAGLALALDLCRIRGALRDLLQTGPRGTRPAPHA